MTPYEIGVHLTAKNDISAVLTAIAGHMVGLNRSTEKLAENFGKLKVAIGGAATAFVGVEVLKFADHAERAGEGLVHAKTMLEASLPAATRMADMAKINAAAWKEAGANMRTGIVGNIEAIHDLRNALGDTGHAIALLPAFNIMKNILDSVSDQASIGDAASSKNVINAVRAFEKMGLADPAHPELMQKALEDYAKTTVGLRGRVTGGQLFTNTQTAGDAALGWSEFFKTTVFPAMIATGGNRVGFGSYQLFSNLWSGGGGNLSSKMQAMGQEKWGLHTSADELTDAGGKFKGFKAGSVWEADKLRANPLEWANDYRQKLKSMGVDIENMQSVQLVIADIARNNKNMKSMLDELLLPSTNRQLNKEVFGNIAGVPNDAAGIVNENDPRAWRQKLSKQWGNLEDAFGEQLVDPFINHVLKPLAGMFKDMSQWGAANPGTLKIIAEGVVALGAALVGVGSVVLLTTVLGPGGLIAAAVVTIGTLAALNWGAVTDGLAAFGKAIDKLTHIGFDWLAEKFNALGDAIMGIVNKLKGWFQKTSFEGGGFGGGGRIINAAWSGGGGASSAAIQRMALGGGISPEVASYIRERAIANGIDPNVALAIAGNEGARGFYTSGRDAGGDHGTSFGPFQLHYSGHGAEGDLFSRATGLDARNRSTWKAQVDWAMSRASKHGWSAWMGARDHGIGRWQGIHPHGGGETHIHVHLDGEVVHHSVVKRIVRGMTHPTTAPYHDGSRHWTPPDAGLVGV